MVLTQLPGFRDPVHDAQRTFRALLTALSQPGTPHTPAMLTPPPGLTPSCAAAALTLFDLETAVWLQPGLPAAAQNWLLFHTGCRFTDTSATADFAIVAEVATMPTLASFNWGTPEYPEASTTLLLQTAPGDRPVTLQGPGILNQVEMAVALPTSFWQQWQTMTTHFPLGLDLWCCSPTQVWGLPRTARLVGDIS